MKVRTQSDLNGMGCANPDCDHTEDEELFLHAGCHLQAALEVAYHRQTGQLHVYCADCGQLVTVIAVASGTEVARAH